MDERIEDRGAQMPGQPDGEPARDRREAAEGLFASIRRAFPVEETDLRTYSPLALAFLGDGVYELVIRSLIVGEANTKPNELNSHTRHLVRAESQAAMVGALLPELSEEEQGVYRRGKNARPATNAKYASRKEYQSATGFEALLGYLYLAGAEERLLTLLRKGLRAIGAPEAGGPNPEDR